MSEKPKPLPAIKRETLGRVGSALLPIEKLKLESPRGALFERELHEFLLTNHNGYTVNSGTISGHWTDDAGKDHYGEHREYRVALPNADSVAAFEVFLATLAHDLGEECIYVEISGEIRLVYALAGGAAAA
jgi:hypothetical protein